MARGKHTDVNAAARGAARASGNAVNVNAIRNWSVCLGRIGAASAFAAKNGGCSDGEAMRGEAMRREERRRGEFGWFGRRKGRDRIDEQSEAKQRNRMLKTLM